MKGFEGPSLPAGRQGFRVLSLKKSLHYLLDFSKLIKILIFAIILSNSLFDSLLFLVTSLVPLNPGILDPKDLDNLINFPFSYPSVII